MTLARLTLTLALGHVLASAAAANAQTADTTKKASTTKALAAPKNDSTKQTDQARADSALLAASKLAAWSCAGPRPTEREKPTDTEISPCHAQLEVFGDGNVKDVLGGGAAKASASAALGMHYVGNRYEVIGMVNIAGTNDTVRAHRGATILVPAAGKALNAGLLSIRGAFKKWNDDKCDTAASIPLRCNWGWRVHADASTRVWATHLKREGEGKDSVDRVVDTMEIPTWGGGLDLSYAFFRDGFRADDGTYLPAQMVLDVGYAHRALRGDLIAKSRAALLDTLVGTSRQHNFDGLEVAMSMVFSQIRTSFTYVWLNGGVDGLSRGQIVASVDLVAPLRSGLLSRRR